MFIFWTRDNIPEIIVDSDLYAHASTLGAVDVLLEADTPSVTCQSLSSLDNHIPDQFTVVHKSSA